MAPHPSRSSARVRGARAFDDDDDDDDGNNGVEEEILEIVDQSLVGKSSKGPSGPLVIPLKEKNEYTRPAAPAKIDFAPVNRETVFVSNAAGVTDPSEERVWGLQKMAPSSTSRDSRAATTTADCADDVPAPKERGDINEEAIAELMREARGEVDVKANSQGKYQVPLLQLNAVPGLNEIEDPKEKYLMDVSMRPEESSLDDYDKIPIEEFGAAMMRGMGWEEGKGVGRNQNGLAKPVVLKRRQHLLGLGAEPTPDDLPPTKRPRNGPGSSSVSNGAVRSGSNSNGRTSSASATRNATDQRTVSASSSDRPGLNSDRNRTSYPDDRNDSRSDHRDWSKNGGPPPSLRVGARVVIKKRSSKYYGQEGRVDKIKDSRGDGTPINVLMSDNEILRLWDDEVDLLY